MGFSVGLHAHRVAQRQGIKEVCFGHAHTDALTALTMDLYWRAWAQLALSPCQGVVFVKPCTGTPTGALTGVRGDVRVRNCLGSAD